MSPALLLIIKILKIFLNTVAKHEDCPDGLCVAPLAKAGVIESQLQTAKVAFGIFDIFSFLRCFPMDRVLAVGKRIVAVFRDCDKCPDGECNFFDLLSCVDLTEVVAIVTEIMDIISDSKMCDGGNGKSEITLGEAVS
jgi:hypothetical protein